MPWGQCRCSKKTKTQILVEQHSTSTKRRPKVKPASLINWSSSVKYYLLCCEWRASPMNQNHRTGLARTQMQPNSPDCGPRNISMGCKIYKQLHSSRLGQSGSSMTCVVLEHCASRWFHSAVRWALAVLVCIWNVNILVWSCPRSYVARWSAQNAVRFAFALRIFVSYHFSARSALTRYCWLRYGNSVDVGWAQRILQTEIEWDWICDSTIDVWLFAWNVMWICYVIYI